MQTPPQKYNTNSRWSSSSSSSSMNRKGDIFMEAGRLAAEYLVSQGVLPPGSLSASRTSALARLGGRPSSIRRMPSADRQTPPPPIPAVDAPDLPPPATTATTSMIDSEEAKIPTQQQESKSEPQPELEPEPKPEPEPQPEPEPEPEPESSHVPAEKSNNHNTSIEVINLDDDGDDGDAAEQPETRRRTTETERQTQVLSDDLFPTTTTAAAPAGAGDDGYGLMISELLHPDDMNNHDDDSIYMSLGEIPLTYLRPWEQPEYEKPFGDA